MGECEAIFFDKRGFAIGDLVATFDRRWNKNEYGEAKFVATQSDVAARAGQFESGNFLLLREADLPDWVGYLDTPESWGAGKVTFTAFSAERLFDQRPGVVDKLYGTGGSIFERVIEMANDLGDTLIRPGEIFAGGNSREESFSPANQLYKDIDRIARRSRNDWDVTPSYTNGKLVLEANWYERKRKRIPFALTEGYNMELKENTLEYEGRVWNYVVAYGNASTWSSRVTHEVWDDESIKKHGLRVTGLAVQSNEEATVQAAAEAHLAINKERRRKLDVSVTDVDGTFRQLRIGHVPDVEVMQQGIENGEVGFTAEMEIIEMIYDHAAGKIDVTLKEY